jgi:hypothetical protein
VVGEAKAWRVNTLPILGHLYAIFIKHKVDVVPAEILVRASIPLMLAVGGFSPTTPAARWRVLELTNFVKDRSSPLL